MLDVRYSTGCQQLLLTDLQRCQTDSTSRWFAYTTHNRFSFLRLRRQAICTLTVTKQLHRWKQACQLKKKRGHEVSALLHWNSGGTVTGLEGAVWTFKILSKGGGGLSYLLFKKINKTN